MADNYKIGEVIKKLHISKETIRYYERTGLLSNPKREKNGYRLYSEADINVIWFILIMKRFGFSLKEIKTLISTLYQDVIGENVNTIELIINKKIDEIDDKITNLENTKKLLQKVSTNLKSQNRKCYNDFESFQEDNT
jgi:MerR family Zn(II)-responsive transcriptional regulator of zntA